MLHVFKSVFLSIGFAAAIAVQAPCAEPIQKHDGLTVWFDNWGGLSNATLVVSAPDGKISQVYTKLGTPVFKLNKATSIDGIYEYELRAEKKEQTAKSTLSNTGVNTLSNAEIDGQSGKSSIGIQKAATGMHHYSSGYFVVESGKILKPREIKEE